MSRRLSAAGAERLRPFGAFGLPRFTLARYHASTDAFERASALRMLPDRIPNDVDRMLPS